MAQIDNISILNPSLLDSLGTVTASSSATGTPAANLLEDQPRNIWKSTSITSQYLEIDTGQSTVMQQIYLGYHNLTSAGTIQVRTADTQGALTSAPVYNQTYEAYTELVGSATDLNDHFPRGSCHFFVNLSSPPTNRWIRLDFIDAANPDGYFKAGRFMVGTPWQPVGATAANPVAQGSSNFGPLDRSPKQTSLAGSTFPLSKDKINTLSANIQYITESEMLDGLDEINRYRGGSDPVLLCLEPSTVQRRHKKLVYGLLEVQPYVLNLKTSGITRYSCSLKISEMI